MKSIWLNLVRTSLVAGLSLIASLNAFERLYGITTIEFYARFKKGLMGDSRDFILWTAYFEEYQYLMHEHSTARATVREVAA